MKGVDVNATITTRMGKHLKAKHNICTTSSTSDPITSSSYPLEISLGKKRSNSKGSPVNQNIAVI